MAKFFLAYLLILIIPISGFSQTNFIDSIRLIIDNNEPPLEKFTHLADMMLKQTNDEGSVIDSTSLMTLHTLAQQLNNDSLLYTGNE